MSGRFNVHATVVVAGETAILIEGPSGSGKSQLAQALAGACRARGLFACLVCDDRAWVEAVGGRLVARAPEAIEGLIELRGFGPAPGAFFERAAVVERVVRLVEPSQAPRFAEDARTEIGGVSLPLIRLPAGHAASAAPAILAWIGQPVI